MSDDAIEYWNRVGPAKPFSVPIDLDRLGTLLTREARIVDIGCGYGRVLQILRDAGYRNLVGVDPAPSMIDAARVRVPEAELHVMSSPQLVPLPGHSVDAALLVGVLTAIPSDEDQRALVREVWRVTKPGGVFCLADFWIQDDARNRERYEEGVKRHGVYGVFDLPEGVTLRHHAREWIEAVTEGFERLATHDIALTTMNGHSARGFQWYGRRPVAPA